jgi:hypothetical protein
MSQPSPSNQPAPRGSNRAVHYVGLAALTIAIVVGLAFIL